MENSLAPHARPNSRVKFIIGGALIIAAVVYLVISATQANAQYFLTIDELNSKGASMHGQNVRISGAVLGNTIQYDSQSLTLKFSIANIPGDNNQITAQGGLATVLHAAVIDPNRSHLQIVYKGVKPDLLKNEAQAVVTGKIGEDGNFYASELLLKCPTKYQDAVPAQASKK